MANKIPAGGRKSRAAKPAAIAPPAREPTIGDNSKGEEEAERVQLISFVSRLTQSAAEVARLKAPFDAAKQAHTQIFKLASAASTRFTRKRLEQLMEEMNTPSRNMAVEVREEAKFRRWLGIIDDDQAQLQLGEAAPQEVKDEAHWKAEGYKAGLRQMEPKPPPECPERFVQPWMLEHARGFKEALTANAPKPLKPSVREQAAADFKADNPDAPEPGSPEAEAAERRSVAKAKESLAKMGSGDPEAGFEATEDELAAQKTRAAVQEARVSDDEPVV